MFVSPRERRLKVSTLTLFHHNILQKSENATYKNLNALKKLVEEMNQFQDRQDLKIEIKESRDFVNLKCLDCSFRVSF